MIYFAIALGVMVLIWIMLRRLIPADQAHSRFSVPDDESLLVNEAPRQNLDKPVDSKIESMAREKPDAAPSFHCPEMKRIPTFPSSVVSGKRRLMPAAVRRALGRMFKNNGNEAQLYRRPWSAPDRSQVNQHCDTLSFEVVGNVADNGYRWSHAIIRINGLSLQDNLLDIEQKLQHRRRELDEYSWLSIKNLLDGRLWDKPQYRCDRVADEWVGILQCLGCELEGCIDIAMRVTVWADRVMWSDFAEKIAGGLHCPVYGGPYLFDRTQYEAAIASLQSSVA